MNVEDYKALALKCCLDIYRDYDETEVLKFAPKSVQHAWETGREYAASERANNAKRIKRFTL